MSPTGAPPHYQQQYPGPEQMAPQQALPPMSSAPDYPGASSTAAAWAALEQDNEPSQGQKNIIKWEQDEVMGDKATISPVLYANTQFPNLRQEYPNWADRVKQISKLWRQVSGLVVVNLIA